MTVKTIALASDHAGYLLKAELKEVLAKHGYAVLDLGANGPDSVDYPDFADAVAFALRDGRAECGVLICGSGVGISIAANRHGHVRAALCADATTARLSREHNDANILVLGARVIGADVAKDCLTTFLDTPFAGGERHTRRIKKLG